MKVFVLLFVVMQQLNAQQKNDDKRAINGIVDVYSKAVIQRDSVAFYKLFNSDAVTWCAALKERSQIKEVEIKGVKEAGSNYFSGSYKGFMRSLFRHKTTEDKFDNIKIVEDGTVASVAMDYSFWADGIMTNWGSKYLGLIKREGQWKITSVIYSLELTDYYPQPPLKERKS
ncbi:nuclear transport factor 2 family protein [Flavobacterium hauense]